jgi:dTDP-4-dehydrorhamnose 3,5-epimerase
MTSRSPKIEYNNPGLKYLKVKDAFHLKGQPFHDERGIFWQCTTWQRGSEFEYESFTQLNFSLSKRGVVRGMHVQTNNPQAKYIFCVQGELLDVVHDLRGDSQTYGVTDYRVLKPGEALYCPAGTAHGFQCLSNTCEIVYLCSTHYDRESDTGFRAWDAKAPWQFDMAVQSEKDSKLPPLAELVRRHDWMR